MIAKRMFPALFIFSTILASNGQENAWLFHPGIGTCNYSGTIMEHPGPIDPLITTRSKDTLFAFDDGTQEAGWNVYPNHLGWLGNYFPVSSSISGFLDTLYVSFLNNAGGSEQMLTLDIFDGNQVIMGSTSSFSAVPGEWITVPAQAIAFNGPFYVMAKWDRLPAATHYLGYDLNGPLASQNLERFRDSTGAWSDVVVMGGASPGNFLVRARATYNPSAVPGNPAGELPLIYPNPAKDKVIVSLQEGIISVKVMTISGLQLLDFQYDETNQVMIDLSPLPDGLYLLSVSSKIRTTFCTIILLR